MFKILEDKVRVFANRCMYFRWTRGEKHVQMWIFSPSLSVFFENGTLELGGIAHKQTKKLALKQNKIIKKGFGWHF